MAEFKVEDLKYSAIAQAAEPYINEVMNDPKVSALDKAKILLQLHSIKNKY